MFYITGKHALNLDCSLDTCGDWHTSALKWEKVTTSNSNKRHFKDWGVEWGKKIPEHTGTYNVANHIRALLDLLEDGVFSVAQGMREDFICNESYTPLVFDMVYELRNSKYLKCDWSDIDAFMKREYRLDWLNYREAVGLQEKDKGELEMQENWREPHYVCIVDFLSHLNSVSGSYVLKGGTALMLCYNLSRFSEGIDLDGFDLDIGQIVSAFCISKGYDLLVAEDTPTPKRFFVHYGGGKPLKIEVSYRVKTLDFTSKTGLINGILVYNPLALLATKINAYAGRDTLRDLYDLVFLSLTYWDELDSGLYSTLKSALSYKGIEQFDFITKDQSDELIDNNELASMFLELWDALGLN